MPDPNGHGGRHHGGHGHGTDNDLGITHQPTHALPAAEMLCLLDRAIGEAQAIIDQVPDAAWANPSPCDGWSARDVANHLVQSNRWAHQLMTDSDRPRPSGDVLGDAPAQAFADSAHALLAALRTPEARGRMYESPFGTMPVGSYCAFLALHVGNHAWDVAKATGQPTGFAPELNETLLGLATTFMGRMPREHAPFAAVVEVADTLPAADRLAAFLGRRP